MEIHQILNELVKKLDPNRKTTMAVISICPTDAEYLNIPDCISYNHYFGWYGGGVSMNGPWFDQFHAEYSKIRVEDVIKVTVYSNQPEGELFANGCMNF